jgi:hypothetical protein
MSRLPWRSAFALAASLGLAVGPAAASTTSEPLAAAAEAQARSGDVLFKSASGLWGRLAARASGDGEGFAHVGIVAIGGNGRLVVIHAGGESSSGRDWRVRTSALASYLDGARFAALYRPALDEAKIARALDYAKKQSERRVPFDHAYSLGSDKELYCTELVWRALMEATGEDPAPEKSRRMGRTFIMLGDLAASPLLALAWRSTSEGSPGTPTR